MKQDQQPETVGRKRTFDGVVARKSGAKTVAVQIVRIIAHPVYGKRIKQTKRYLAHDASDALAVGDAVTIHESKPLSARKRWIAILKEGKTL